MHLAVKQPVRSDMRSRLQRKWHATHEVLARSWLAALSQMACGAWAATHACPFQAPRAAPWGRGRAFSRPVRDLSSCASVE